MLKLFSSVKCFRLSYKIIPAISNVQFRYMSDKSKEAGNTDKKAGCEKKKEPEFITKKKEPECKKEPAKPNEPVCKKEPVKPKKPVCKKEPAKPNEPVCKKEPVKPKEPVCKKEPEKPKEPVCKKEPEKPKESVCKKEPEKPKEPVCKKEPEKPKEPVCKKKDETAIAGGATCKPKEPALCPSPPPTQEKLPKTCEELILERKDLNKKGNSQNLTIISGGGPNCPCPPSPDKPPNSDKHSKRWGRICLLGVLPLVAVLTVLVFTTHKEAERPEFAYYTHLYKRTKPFFWGDGNKSRFHNAHWNALPPDGYEDEIDAEAAGKVPETDKERKERLKEFSAVQKEWTKMNDNR